MKRHVALLPLALAGCVAPRRAPPVVSAAPPVAKLAPAAPVEEAEWQDVPLTPGTWVYAATAGSSTASYGRPDRTVLTIRCDRPRGQVVIAQLNAPAAALTIRTSYGVRTLPPAADGTASASLAARDPLLDQIAFSRGRFSVTGSGPTLYLPAWAEPARVIEDCRG